MSAAAASGSLLLRGGRVLTVDDRGPSLRLADVAVEGRTISSVTRGHLADRHFDVVADVEGCCIMPGLVDLHFHTGLGKGRFDDLPLGAWIDAWWYPVLRAMDPEITYWAAMLAYSDALRCGTTCVNDMSRHLPSLAAAATDVGLRVVVSNTITDDATGLDRLDDTVAALPDLAGFLS